LGLLGLVLGLPGMSGVMVSFGLDAMALLNYLCMAQFSRECGKSTNAF
jgi:hypothetical protein